MCEALELTVVCSWSLSLGWETSLSLGSLLAQQLSTGAIPPGALGERFLSPSRPEEHAPSRTPGVVNPPTQVG